MRWRRGKREMRVARREAGSRPQLPVARWRSQAAMCWSPAVRASGEGERRLLRPANWNYRPVVAVEFLGKLSFKVQKTRLCGFAQVGLSIVLETRSIDLLEAEALALHAQLKKLSLFSSRGLV